MKSFKICSSPNPPINKVIRQRELATWQLSLLHAKLIIWSVIATSLFSDFVFLLLSSDSQLIHNRILLVLHVFLPAKEQLKILENIKFFSSQVTLDT